MARRHQEGLHEVHETEEGNEYTPEIPQGLLEEVESLTHGVHPTGEMHTNGPGEGPKKTKKTVEEKRADFKRLADRRVSTALDAIDSLIHLCAPQSYAWAPEARALIFDTLRQRLTNVERCFYAVEQSGGKKAVRPLSFTLPV
jgi:hypothetical protein